MTTKTMAMLTIALMACLPAGARVSKPITGTFIQLDGGNLTYTKAQWRSEFEGMKKLGCDTLVVGEVARQDTGFCKLAGYPMFPKSGTADPFETMLDTARQFGFRVFVGTYAWDWKKQDPEDFEEYARRCCDIATQVWQRYGKHPAFHGWYVLGWEIGNAPPVDNIGVKAHMTVIEQMRKLAPKLPILVAPYFTLDVSPDDFESGWKKLLAALDVDIVALQDGVGCDRHITPESARPYFRAMANACRSSHVVPWADVEVFDQPAGWKPAQPERVVQQLKSISPFVEKIVIWEFNHNLSPNRGFKTLEPLAKAIKG